MSRVQQVAIIAEAEKLIAINRQLRAALAAAYGISESK